MASNTLFTNVPARDVHGTPGLSRELSVTAAVTLTGEQHDGRTLLLDNAAGATVTLPAAKGTGNRFRFLVKTTVTSNGYIVKVANSTDAFIGFSEIVSDDAGAPVKGFIASALSDDTITLNGTTTGGYAGDYVEVEDIASGVFAVRVLGKATGTEATPFSATV